MPGRILLESKRKNQYATQFMLSYLKKFQFYLISKMTIHIRINHVLPQGPDFEFQKFFISIQHKVLKHSKTFFNGNQKKPASNAGA